MIKNYTVKPVTREECEPFILGIHYARRWPSISFAYGLLKGEDLVGVVTYGSPPSSTLKRGLAGDDYKDFILELNRLCLRDNLKNEASILVSRSLKLLPPNKIIISFADTSQGHVGTVYQACNFTYHGLSAKRTDWKIRGKEHLHSYTIADEFRGVKNRSKAIRDKYGENFYLEPRPRKHRYVFITGSKKWRRKAFKAIRYEQQEYPQKSIDI